MPFNTWHERYDMLLKYVLVFISFQPKMEDFARSGKDVAFSIKEDLSLLAIQGAVLLGAVLLVLVCW